MSAQPHGTVNVVAAAVALVVPEQATDTMTALLESGQVKLAEQAPAAFVPEHMEG
jgi:hypothetical protein